MVVKKKTSKRHAKKRAKTVKGRANTVQKQLRIKGRHVKYAVSVVVMIALVLSINSVYASIITSAKVMSSGLVEVVGIAPLAKLTFSTSREVCQCGQMVFYDVTGSRLDYYYIRPAIPKVITVHADNSTEMFIVLSDTIRIAVTRDLENNERSYAVIRAVVSGKSGDRYDMELLSTVEFDRQLHRIVFTPLYGYIRNSMLPLNSEGSFIVIKATSRDEFTVVRHFIKYVAYSGEHGEIWLKIGNEKLVCGG